jgi:hypothetical protein
LLYRDESYTVEEGGKQVHKTLHVSDDYDEVDFPMRAMKPVILQAAARAMALKIFDQIGTVENSRAVGDPILVGQLLDPRGNRRRTTFFIAWWVDTEML